MSSTPKYIKNVSKYGYESKPWYPDGTLSWFMDVYSPKHGNTIGLEYMAMDQYLLLPFLGG
jgi:hypothetical protein